MKSILYTDDSPFSIPPACTAERTEIRRTFRKNGRLFTVTVRDKLVVDDEYVNMVKAVAFSIQTQEPYRAMPTNRKVKDSLLKQDLVI